jgi:biopolymer transport protein ExbD
MNLRKHLRNAGEEPHTSALNDILFILLFFFLIVSTMANPNVIKLAIPRMKSQQKAKQSIVVSIDSTQKFFVGTHPVVVDSLNSALMKLAAKNPQDTATIVINADKKANAESIIAVMRAAREQKLKAVLAVENK